MAIKFFIKKLKIENFKIKELKLYISLNVFNKFDIFRIKIDEKKFNKIISKSSSDIDLKSFKPKEIEQIFEEIKIDGINIYAKIGTTNIIFTSFVVTLVASAIAIILSKKIEKPEYRIEPVYDEQNYTFLSINCIFKIKLVHIINIIKKLNGKEYQKNGRTSNRRAYGGCNG